MIKTTVVGSYPVPLWLRVTSTRESLRDAILAIIKTQELAGIDVVADGELYRWDINHAETNGMIDYFVRPMSGVASQLTAEQLAAWRQKGGTDFRAKPPGIVIGNVGAGQLDLAADYELFRDLTQRPKKFTVTSPYMLARTLLDRHYGEFEALLMALADQLAEQVADLPCCCVQVDEANIPGNPADGPIAAQALNRVLDAIPAQKAVHFCFGNYGGQTIQDGDWKSLTDFLNMLHCDYLVLELAHRPDDDLQALKDVSEDIALGLGVIDIKVNHIETADQVAARIEKAISVLGPGRVKWVHPDCGFWMLARSVADRKMAALVAGRCQFLGR